MSGGKWSTEFGKLFDRTHYERFKNILAPLTLDDVSQLQSLDFGGGAKIIFFFRQKP